jgi:hypothetical protein
MINIREVGSGELEHYAQIPMTVLVESIFEVEIIDGVLMIDETGFLKKMTKSVGVKR